MSRGYLNSKTLWTVVEAQVADRLAENGPQPVSTLGLRCGIQPERLAQLLDTLVSNGIFAYNPADDTYSNNRASLLLCHDHWTQWHLWADLYPNEFFDVSRAMPQAVRLGESRTALLELDCVHVCDDSNDLSRQWVYKVLC